MKVKYLNKNIIILIFLTIVFKTTLSKIVWYRVDGLNQEESDLKVRLTNLVILTKRQIFLTRRLTAYDLGLKNHYNTTEERIFIEKVLQNVTEHSVKLDIPKARLFLDDLIETMKIVRFGCKNKLSLRRIFIGDISEEEFEEIDKLRRIYFYRTVKLLLLLKELEYFRYSEECIKKILEIIDTDKYLLKRTRYMLYRAFNSICLAPEKYTESIKFEKTFKTDYNFTNFIE